MTPGKARSLVPELTARIGASVPRLERVLARLRRWDVADGRTAAEAIEEAVDALRRAQAAVARVPAGYKPPRGRAPVAPLELGQEVRIVDGQRDYYAETLGAEDAGGVFHVERLHGRTHALVRTQSGVCAFLPRRHLAPIARSWKPQEPKV